MDNLRPDIAASIQLLEAHGYKVSKPESASDKIRRTARAEARKALAESAKEEA